MKKALAGAALAIALAVGVGLPTIALADSSLTDSTTSASHDVSAKKVVDTIAATVSWGDMQFTYNTRTKLWESSDTNSISVTNNSTIANLIPRYGYALNNSFSDMMGFGFFTTNTSSFTADQDPGADFKDLSVNQHFEDYGTLAPNGSQTVYAMFTDSPTNLDGLSGTDFSSVGTLTVEITGF